MSKRALLPLWILTAGAALLHAQAMIEYGATAGRSAGAVGAAGAGKSAVKIFDKLSTSLAGAAKVDETPSPRSVSPTVAVAATTAPAPAPAPAAPPDFTALVAGMDRADLFKKVGKPSMTMSSMESSKLTETCWYKSGAANVTVILRDGKVAEFSGVEKSAQ